MKKQLLALTAALYFFASCSTFNNQNSDRSPSSATAEQIISHGGQVNQIDWRNLFYELNYINQFKMSNGDYDFSNRVVNSMYYSPEGFNAAYAKIVASSKNTKEAFRNREDLMGVNDAFTSRMAMRQQLNKSKALGASSLVSLILSTADDARNNPKVKLGEGNNYFTTAVGQSATEILKDYVIVVVPGFGSHTIKDYTWPEILRHANAFYNRPLTRPSTKRGDKDVFQPMEEFYGKNQTVGFDVVHPMGFELGYSMGSDKESGANLAAWLLRLKKLPAYADKKFILIGYSKGTPISINAFTNTPEVTGSIAAIFTMAGVAQGAVPANTFIKNAYEKSSAVSRENLIDDLTDKLKRLEANIGNVVTATKGMLVANSVNEKYVNQAGDMVKTLLATGGISLDHAEDRANFTDVADKRKAIEGVVDMSNYESLQWNLKNYNNQKFTKPVSIFNISMLTNVKDFVRPNPSVYSYLTPPLIVPQFTSEGMIVYNQFSKDNVFLYLTSMSGFEESVAGAYDTQVAWLDTKSMALDARPLSHSLDPKQLSMMRDRLAKEGISLPSDFASVPRRDLLKSLSKAKGGFSNVNFVDLGEFRGTHWDVAFEQVYKPSIPNQEYYKHQFPRRALQASVIEMLAVYKQLGGL